MPWSVQGCISSRLRSCQSHHVMAAACCHAVMLSCCHAVRAIMPQQSDASVLPSTIAFTVTSAMRQCSPASCAVMLHDSYWPTCKSHLHQDDTASDSCRLQNRARPLSPSVASLWCSLGSVVAGQAEEGAP